MNDISRRSVLKLGAISGLALSSATVLAACTSTGTSQVKSGNITLDLWTHDSGYEKYFTSEAAALTPYSVNTTKYSSADLVTKLIATASAGRALPDMAGIEIGQFSRLMKNGIAGEMFEDLTPHLNSVKNDLIQARLAPFSVDGKVYGLDSDNPLVVYYYRADLFDKYKIPNPQTWEEFAGFGASFYQKEKIALLPVNTGPTNADVSSRFMMFLLQRGGAFFDKSGNVTVDSPEAVDTLQFIVDGLKSGFIIGLDNFYGGSIQAAFKSSQLIGAAMPDWYNVYGIQATVPEQKGLWKIRPMPMFSGGGLATSTQGGTGFGALKGQHSAAVIDLLAKTYLTVSGQVQRFKDVGYLPTLKSAYGSAELLSYADPFLSGQKTFEIYAPLADKGPNFYQSPNLSILNDSLGGPLLDAYKGNISPSTAIKNGVAAYTQQTK